MKIGEIIKKYCFDHDMSQRSFAIKAGVSNSYITQLINDKNPKTNKPMKIKIETYDALSKAMEMSIDELFEIMDDAPVELPKSKSGDISFLQLEELTHHKIPLIGSVAGGEPIYDEEVDLYIDGPAKASCAVRLKGDSMEPEYKDGDIIYIKEQPDVRDGQVAVVIVDSEATLKCVYHIPNGLQLLPLNRSHAPILATFNEYNYIRILGVPIGYTRMFDKSGKVSFGREIKKGMTIAK